MTAGQHSTRPCHQAAASPLTAARGAAHSAAPRSRARSVKAWSVARKTLGCTRSQRPEATRLLTPRAPSPAPTAWRRLITPSCRRKIPSIRTASPSAITPAAVAEPRYSPS
ncbi:hypothetical protein [Pseudonocardia sp.]|uniref:hypothetical protein n=1 Tax=Pseudonocardia sp. TaxID=60912 RepID=UPI0039C8D813